MGLLTRCLCRILFYPPLVYACWVWIESRVKVRDREGHGEVDDHVGEDTPLLGERS